MHSLPSNPLLLFSKKKKKKKKKKRLKTPRSTEFLDPTNDHPDNAVSSNSGSNSKEACKSYQEDGDTATLEPLAAGDEPDEDSGFENTILPPTLGRRKKRRPSPAAIDNRGVEAKSGPSIAPNDQPPYTPKSGSKRKFDPSEDGTQWGKPACVDRDDNFRFTRPALVARNIDTVFASASPPFMSERKEACGQRSARKRNALEPSMCNP